MRLSIVALTLGLVALSGAARAESAYTTLDTDSCELVKEYEGMGADLKCPGYDGIEVFVADGDGRLDVDYGIKNENFESFFAFNNVGEKIEWMLGADGAPYAAALRYLISVDGREAQALVVSKIGSDEAPGCVVGVVDATADQANGIARGLGAMAPLFNCAADQVVIVPGAAELVAGFGGANR